MRTQKEIDQAAIEIGREAYELAGLTSFDTPTRHDVLAAAQNAARMALGLLCQHDQETVALQQFLAFDEDTQAAIEDTNRLFSIDSIEEVA